MTKKQIITKLSNTVEVLNNEIASIEDLLVENRKYLKDYDADLQLMLSIIQVRNYVRDNLKDWKK